MKTRLNKTRSMMETLEGRALMSTVAYGDFNNDGREDKAELTNPTTITVSLKKSDGTYKVSAALTMPKSRPATQITAVDMDSDGDLDLNAYGFLSNGWYAHRWVNKGDGTFGTITTEIHRSKPPKGFF